MDATQILLILAVLFGFYVAWNIGANDVANAVGTSVGSGALTLKQAVLIAAIFEFVGAFFLGSNVSETLEAGIVNPEIFSDDLTDYVYGMLASLLAAGVWLQIASYFGWPVSTTHSIVGAVLGFGLVLGGIESIFWGKIGSIVLSWIISPLLGGALSYILFSILRRKILYQSNPIQAAKKTVPYIVFFMFFVLTLIVLFNGLENLELKLNFFEATGYAIVASLFCSLLSTFLVRSIRAPVSQAPRQNLQVSAGLQRVHKHLKRIEAAAYGEMQGAAHELLKKVRELEKRVEVKEEELSHEYRVVEKMFMYLQIITACFMAFAHGSNDVANAIGPLSAIYNVLHGKPILTKSVSSWLLLLGGVGILFGLATWGWRVIETVGRKITELTPTRGFAAGLAAAVTIVLASKLGLPISTTHVLVGAVLGIGFARGIEAINLHMIKEILISWVVTVPAGAIFSVIFFFILKFLLQNI